MDIFADLGRRPVWQVTGDRPLAFLHDMLTADVAALRPGSGALAALLSDKGRLRAIARVLATGDDALLDADEASAEGIEAGLARIAPLGGAEMERDDRVLIRFAGDPPPEIDDGIGAAEHSHAARDGAIVVRTHWGGRGLDVLAVPEAAGAWLARLGGFAIPVDPSEIEALRVRDGVPRFGVDVTEDTLINESELLDRAVSFTKGCYPGQESVAKIRNLGRVRRRVVGLRLGAEAAAGAEVLGGDGSRAGTITSVADGFAIATIDADAGALTVGGAPASIVGG